MSNSKLINSNLLNLGNKGQIEFLLLAIVALGAFFMAGGQYIMNTLPKGGFDPTASSSATPAPGGTGTGSAEWKIDIAGTSSCDKPTRKAIVSVALSGKEKGYFGFGLKDQGQLTSEFSTLPTQIEELSLSADDNFNTKPWQIKLFSGGSGSGHSFSGGTLQVTKDMDPTNCP